MSDPSPSTESDPLTTNNDHDQPSGPARAPGGSRTPRRVQWASAVDKDDRDPGSEEVSNHELDEAGLDVCWFSLFLTFLTHRFPFLFTASCLPNAHSCSRTSSLKFRFASSNCL
jgi:hypothetical protein